MCRPRVAICCLLLLVSAVRAPALTGADVALYADEGAWSDGVTAITNMLRWIGMSCEKVYAADLNASAQDFSTLYKVIVIPGGWAASYNESLSYEGKQRIRSFVSNGGGYIGICAGAFFACDNIVWQGVPYGDPSGYDLDLFQGTGVGPINEIAVYPSSADSRFLFANAEPALAYCSQTPPFSRNMLYYGGPYFIPVVGANTDYAVLATYAHTGVYAGQRAIVSFRYGNGKVVLIAPHPETDAADWDVARSLFRWVHDYKLVVRSAHGTAVPPAGANGYAYNTALIARVGGSPVLNGTTQYVCTGWSGTGSVPASGGTTNTPSFSLTNDSRIVWLWRTNYWLDTGTDGNGAVNVGDGWFAAGTSVTLTATASANHHFTQWTGSGVPAGKETNNPIGFAMTRPRAITANFAKGAPQLSGVADTNVWLYGLLAMDVSAADPDNGTTLTLTAPVKPAAAVFTDNGDGTGTFTWTPNQVSDLGDHTVRFVASDGELAGTNEITVHVSTFTVTEPGVGAVLRGTNALAIAWTGQSALGAVDIDLWNGTNHVLVLTNNLAAPASNMTWQTILDGGLPARGGYRVVVTDVSNPDDYASSAPFLIGFTANDFDGDGQSDIGLFRAATGKIWAMVSGSGSVLASAAGMAAWLPAVGDYDGDGKADYSWFIPSTATWRIYESSQGYAERLPRVTIGGAADIPVAGADFDGDGRADIAVFRSSSGKLWIRHSGQNYTNLEATAAGAAAWLPTVGDYDGDGKADYSWFIPSTTVWRIYESSQGYAERLPRLTIGGPDDVPVAGADLDADRKADLAVFRRATGKLWVRCSSLNYTNLLATAMGMPTWLPAVGDYDGDGRADYSWFIPSTQVWRVYESSNGYAERPRVQLGGSNDWPLAAPLLGW